MEEKPLAVVRSQGGRSCRQLWSTFMVEETIAKKTRQHHIFRAKIAVHI
jgi:hypothetical protein